MHHPRDRIAHTTASVTPVVEHWLEWELVQGLLFKHLVLMTWLTLLYLLHKYVYWFPDACSSINNLQKTKTTLWVQLHHVFVSHVDERLQYFSNYLDIHIIVKTKLLKLWTFYDDYFVEIMNLYMQENVNINAITRSILLYLFILAYLIIIIVI